MSILKKSIIRAALCAFGPPAFLWGMHLLSKEYGVNIVIPIILMILFIATAVGFYHLEEEYEEDMKELDEVHKRIRSTLDDNR